MKVVFYPRDRNPYQGSLMRELNAVGITATFMPERTPSHSVNLLLLPIESLVARLRGVRIVHLHWVHRFELPHSSKIRPLRYLGRWWFGLWLLSLRLLGIRLVWTAHNVLPHHQVFPDDVEARAILLGSLSGVIVHAESGLQALAARGWSIPPAVGVIRPGPVESLLRPAAEHAGKSEFVEGSGRVVGMVGRVEDYKDPEGLLKAAIELASSRQMPADAKVLVAGECLDEGLRSRLLALASRDDRVTLDLRFLEDDEFNAYVRYLDVLVLPFRAITSSASATAAINAGTTVLVPREVRLDDLPEECLARYDDLVEGLRWALTAAPEEIRSYVTLAQEWTDSWTWRDAAQATVQIYRQIAGGKSA